MHPDAPPGSTPNSLALSPDEATLYVANANLNVVAVFVILISIIPVYLAHKLTREEGGAAPTRGAAPSAVAAEGTAAP